MAPPSQQTRASRRPRVLRADLAFVRAARVVAPGALQLDDLMSTTESQPFPKSPTSLHIPPTVPSAALALKGSGVGAEARSTGPGGRRRTRPRTLTVRCRALSASVPLLLLFTASGTMAADCWDDDNHIPGIPETRDYPIDDTTWSEIVKDAGNSAGAVEEWSTDNCDRWVSNVQAVIGSRGYRPTICYSNTCAWTGSWKSIVKLEDHGCGEYYVGWGSYDNTCLHNTKNLHYRNWAYSGGDSGDKCYKVWGSGDAVSDCAGSYYTDVTYDPLPSPPPPPPSPPPPPQYVTSCGTAVSTVYPIYNFCSNQIQFTESSDVSCTSTVCSGDEINKRQNAEGGACTKGCVNACWTSLGLGSSVLRLTGIDADDCAALTAQTVAANPGITVFAASSFDTGTEETAASDADGECLDSRASNEWRLYGNRCYLIASNNAKQIQWPVSIPYELTCSALGSLCSADSFYGALHVCQDDLDGVSALELALGGILMSDNPPKALICRGQSCPFDVTQRTTLEQTIENADASSKKCAWIQSNALSTLNTYACSWNSEGSSETGSSNTNDSSSSTHIEFTEELSNTVSLDVDFVDFGLSGGLSSTYSESSTSGTSTTTGTSNTASKAYTATSGTSCSIA